METKTVKEKVYFPIKNEEDYLPYFTKVVEEGEEFYYLIKEVRIDPNSELYSRVVKDIESQYNDGGFH